MSDGGMSDARLATIRLLCELDKNLQGSTVVDRAQLRALIARLDAAEREAVDAAFHKSWCAVIDLLDRDYITPAKLREAIVPFVAAEILAAEARGMGRARTVVQNTRDGMKFDPSATQEWRNAITGGFNAADLALRHELDAMEDFDD